MLSHVARRGAVVVAAAAPMRCASFAIAACATKRAQPQCAQHSTLAAKPRAMRSAVTTARPLSTAATPSSTSAPAAASAEWNNVTAGIESKIGRNLHLRPGHPLNIIKNRIAYYFDARARAAEAAAVPGAPKEQHRFTLVDNVSPIVSAKENFDDLLFPADHVGRSQSDTFYYTKERLLRTHTSAHQGEYMRSGLSNFLVVGDCYRRDEIDASHYPVFHQMEGVRVFPHDEARFNRGEAGVQLVVDDLKSTLDGLVRYLFGSDIEVRWIEGSFPFTYPSFEMEILFQGEWLEVFGCGVIQPAILDACAPPLKAGVTNGWAFGLGLERLAMVLFDIPDIRLFWSEDPRFLDQFAKIKEDLHATNGQFKRIQFQPFSKYPACFKDVSFWVPEGTAAPAASATPAPAAALPSAFHENDFCSMVREISGDLVENVTLIDSFVHPKTKATSKCYRIMYRSLGRTLTNEEIDILQEQVRDQCVSRLGLQLR